MLVPRPSSLPAVPGDPDPGPVLHLPGPIGAVLGLPAGAAAAIVAWTLGGDPTVGLMLAAAAAAGLAAMTTPTGALLAAALCWACYDGFVVHRFGTLDADRADLVALGTVVGIAVVAHMVGVVVAHGRETTRPSDPMPSGVRGPCAAAGQWPSRSVGQQGVGTSTPARSCSRPTLRTDSRSRTLAP